MSVIDRLKQARNADQIAAEFEPMCQAIEALSVEAALSVESLKAQTAETMEKMEAVRAQLEETLKAAERAAKGMEGAAASFNLKMWLLALGSLIGGAAAAALTIWIWLSPSPSVKTAASQWAEVASTYNNLPQDQKRQFRHLMGWPDPKNAPRQ
jgi:hypothetical protein